MPHDHHEVRIVTLACCLALALSWACGGDDDGGEDGGADTDAGHDADGAASEDAGAVDGAVVDPCAGVDCDDGIDCTHDRCDAGACQHTVDHTLCDTGQFCALMTGCAASTICTSDADCDSPTDPCLGGGGCNPATRTCEYEPFDGDADGQPPIVCGGTDCDDGDPGRYAGAPELCDSIDNDCDGATDSPLTAGACEPGRVCAMGACACAAGLDDCGTSGCADFSSDPRNCGGCRIGCRADEVCSSGACVCSGGMTACGLTCVDTSTDTANCGMCGRTCMTGATCAAGTCACPAGAMTCGGACVDVSSDPANCGSCGHLCMVSTSCVTGACRPEVIFGESLYGDATSIDYRVLERVAVSTSGTVFSAGSVRTQLRDPNTGFIRFTGSSSARQAYIWAYDTTGTSLWRMHIVPYTTTTSSTSVDTRDLENEGAALFWAGQYNRAIRFGETTGPELTSTNADGALAKIGTDGTVAWVKRLGTNAMNDDIRSVAPDGAGGVFAVGTIGGTFDFGGGDRASTGTTDGYVVHYDALGTHVASWRLPGLPRMVRRDGTGDVWVAGEFTGTVDLGDGAITSAGSSDVYVAQLSPTGTLRATHQIGGLVADNVYGFVVTSDSFYLSTGEYLVARFDRAGVLQWFKSTMMGLGTATPRDLAVGRGGAILVAGGSNGMYDYGGGPLRGLSHGFVVRYTTAGVFDWQAEIRSHDLEREAGWVHGLGANPAGDIGIAGFHRTEVYLGSLRLRAPPSMEDSVFVIGLSDR